MSSARDVQPPEPVPSLVRRLVPIRPGEGITALLLAINVFVLLTSYYVLKVVREPLILLGGGGAELKAYASGGQTLLLLAVVPAFGALASRTNRLQLLTTVQAFFIACLVAFYLLAQAALPIGIPFYLWLGIFNVLVVSNFWSFANDLYTQEQGKRLFAIIGLGGSAGAILGALVPAHLHRLVGTYELMLVAAGGLAISTVIYRIVDRRERHDRAGVVQLVKPEAVHPVAPVGGFELVARDRYLRLVAIMVLVATLINATGEYVVGKLVSEAAAGQADRGAYIAGFYSSYYAGVNVISTVLQALVVSRVLSRLGIRRALWIMPVIVIGGWLAFLAFATIATIRVTKTAENSVDYSLHNTLRQALYLPTSRESKYQAKAAIDTFFFRLGDVAAGLGVVFVLVDVLGLGVHAFAAINVVLSALWLWLAARAGRLHDQRAAERADRAAHGLRETAL